MRIDFEKNKDIKNSSCNSIKLRLLFLHRQRIAEDRSSGTANWRNKMKYISIEKQINGLKDGANEKEMFALNKLHEQFSRASNARWTKKELSDLIKEEDDALDGFEQDTAFYEEVREIQDSIINFFAE